MIWRSSKSFPYVVYQDFSKVRKSVRKKTSKEEVLQKKDTSLVKPFVWKLKSYLSDHFGYGLEFSLTYRIMLKIIDDKVCENPKNYEGSIWDPQG